MDLSKKSECRLRLRLLRLGLLRVCYCAFWVTARFARVDDVTSGYLVSVTLFHKCLRFFGSSVSENRSRKRRLVAAGIVCTGARSSPIPSLDYSL